MSSSLPPNAPRRLARPGYLVAALVVASMMGMGGLTNGCHVLQFYRQSTHPSPAADSRMSSEIAARVEMVHQARVHALTTYSSRMIPLAAANAILSMLLIIAAAGALGGRPKSHALALQAVAANLAWTVVDYVLEHPLRGIIIDAASRHPPGFAPGPEPPPASIGWWFFRGILVVQVLAFGLIAIALTRPRVTAFYGDQQPEEEET